MAVGESSPTAGQAGDLSGAWIDRDVSWLEFNRRVLHEALDERTPLLERVKFLAIFSANLDEFFMKRMARLADPTGLAAPAQRELAARIRAMVTSMLDEQAGCYTQVLRPRLAEHGIRLVGWDDLDAAQRDEASAVFESDISPVLTPLSLDAAHPFPYVSNLSTSWAFQLEDPVSGEAVLVRVKLPTDLPQWLRVRADGSSEWVFVGLDQVIRANAERLFPGMMVASASLFRVCRDADVELDENDGLSKRAMVEEELRQRRFEPVVRLEVQPDADSAMVAELVDRFGLAADAVYEMSALLDYTTLFEIAGLDVDELRDPPWTPLAPRVLEAAPDSDIFSAIRSADILLHHPYESFYASVERFIREAADDPQTLSIKMTVYRVGDDTPFVRSLIAAAEAGKQVACVIELNARFDEERNLHWSRELERVGAHVMFGVTGLKTHSKVALVVRNERRRHPQLRPHRHRQLPHPHRQAVRGRRPAHGRPGHHRGRGLAVPLPDRAFADAVVLGAAGRPAAHEGAVRRAARGRDREPRGGPAGPDRLQDEPARGPRDVRPAVPRLAGRGCPST